MCKVTVDNDDNEDVHDDNDDVNDDDDDDNDQFVHLRFEIFSTAKNFSDKEQIPWHRPSNQLAHHLNKSHSSQLSS